VRAQVIVLAGPSGAGKSRLARRLGLPVLRLDDFYKEGGDPTLPVIDHGPNAGLVDWDHPGTWLRDEAVAALGQLCETGRVRVPVYEIARNGRTGTQELALGRHHLFVAEGVFAADVVQPLRETGLLAAAYCITRPPALTFWLRLTRDLKERRKPPAVLVKRGLALMRQQSDVVAAAVAKGCVVATPDEAYAGVRRLLGARPPERMPWGRALKQPDRYSCGPTALVVARMLRDPEYAAETLPRFGAVVQGLHRTLAGPWAAGPQVPWPRRLGTAFWTVSDRLADIEGRTYATRPGYLRPGRAFDRLHRAAGQGRLSALYVGTRLLPRHVALVVGTHGDDLAVFDPATGHVVRLTRAAFTGRRIGLGGWPRLWTVLLPTD